MTTPPHPPAADYGRYAVSPARVLIVDDTEANRYVVSRILAGAGFEIVGEESNGAAAIAAARGLLPDVIVLDVRLPDMSGFAVTEQLRAGSETAPIGILQITAEFTGSDARLRGLAAGADAFLTHPIDPAELIATTNTLVRMRQAERARDRLVGSESWARAMFDRSPLAKWAWDEESCAIVEVNAAACELFGYTADELIGRPVFDLLPPDDAIALRSLIASGLPDELDAERRVRRSNGEIRILQLGTQWLAFNGRRYRVVAGLDITDRRTAEAGLRFQAQLLGAVKQAVIATDLHGRIMYWSPFAEQLYGWTRGEAIGRLASELIVPQTSARHAREVMTGMARGEPWSGDFVVCRRDGSTFVANVTNVPLRDEAGQLTGFLGVSVDVTEKRLLEEQLRQSQKMEAVGQLAGGIAHDFNNLLTVMMSSSEILLADVRPEDPIRRELEEIHAATERAAALTRQLLAFSRRQVLQPQVVDAARAVGGLERMLVRLLGEDVHLDADLSPELWPVYIDPGHLEQVIVNLSLNARDAMPTGGVLRVSARNMSLHTPPARPWALEPSKHRIVQGGWALDRFGDPIVGDFVVLTVADSGSGMSAETLSRAFEPFFTTKGVGKGTGLGLSTVDGIIRQSHGHLVIDSAPGEGTTAFVFLPRHHGEAVTSSDSFDVPPSGHGGCVLLVEDEAAVRTTVTRALTRAGYTVLAVSAPEEALDVVSRRAPEISLVLTDFIMPGMNGMRLAERLSAEGLSVPVVFMSGYTDDAIDRSGELSMPQHFLQKPFTIPELTARVRQAIGG